MLSGRLLGDTLEDARRPAEIRIDSLALQYIPLVGPAAWAVYTYLISRAAHSPAAWPADDEIASACGISTYNAGKSVETLLQYRLVGRHVWKGHPRGRVTYTILPVVAPDVEGTSTVTQQPGSDLEELTVEEPPMHFGEPVELESLAAEPEPALVTKWNRETQERRTARQIFDAFVEILRLDPSTLTDDERANLGLASRIVSESGGQPEQIPAAARRFARLWPDRTIDALDIANNWSLLVPPTDQPQSPGGSGETGDFTGAFG